MILSFNRRKIEELVAFEMSHDPGVIPYTGNGWDRPEVRARGLCLVGDQGVYLIANNSGGEAPCDSGRIAYARECDPTQQDFDTWWPIKNTSFGPDDGVEFVPLPEIQRWLDRLPDTQWLHILLTPERWRLIVPSNS